MKKAAAVFQIVAMLVSFGLTAWSLNEARTQRDAARQAAQQLAQVQAAYDAAMAAAAQTAPAGDPTASDAAQADPNAAVPAQGDALPSEPLTREQADGLAAEHKQYIQIGSSIGRVWIEGTALDCGLYWGDSDAIRNLGGGCRATDGCVMPGENGTVFIGGHNGGFFADLRSAQAGSVIHLETAWGDFRYQITETRVVDENDTSAFAWGGTTPRCILCTPNYGDMLDTTASLYLVYADPVAADEQGVLPFASTSV